MVQCDENWDNEKLKKTELFDKVIDFIDRMKKYNKSEVMKNGLEDMVAKLNYNSDM
nr:hypothetical protein [uncultured Ilyobacter sp.]